MQAFIDFIFFEVWCRAPSGGPYNLNLFDGSPELKEVMTAFAYSDAKGADFFSSHVERIYGFFQAFSSAQIDAFKQWYQHNNDIERACANDVNVIPLRYKKFPQEYRDLALYLARFFKGLYSKSLLQLTALRDKIGDIDDHYKTFVSTNAEAKCPFCGIGDLKGNHHSKRDAYDHYLPKALYPFNSINFRNLVPACHECNSTYKLGKDPIHTRHGRRKAFNPYAEGAHTVELRVTLKHADAGRLSYDDIDLDFGPEEVREEVETWKDVYGLEERYKAKLLGPNDGTYWLKQALGEWSDTGRAPTDYLAEIGRQARSQPYADCNFLKKPFLDACKQLGLF